MAKTKKECEHNFELAFYCNKYTDPKTDRNMMCRDTLFTDSPTEPTNTSVAIWLPVMCVQSVAKL